MPSRARYTEHKTTKLLSLTPTAITKLKEYSTGLKVSDSEYIEIFCRNPLWIMQQLYLQGAFDLEELSNLFQEDCLEDITT